MTNYTDSLEQTMLPTIFQSRRDAGVPQNCQPVHPLVITFD